MKAHVYLHGFASAPSSRKAQFFRERYAEHGTPLEIPELDEGDFQNLTISSQLGVIERLIGGRPAVLIGSSMGGYLAALYASRHPEVEKVLLLAPAFYFPQRWQLSLGSEKVAQWEQSGTMEFYHYGQQRQRQVGYTLVQDGQNYPPAPDFRQPGLIFHGTKDDVVPFEYSKEFATEHPNVTLRLLESGHELTDALPAIWEGWLQFGPGW